MKANRNLTRSALLLAAALVVVILAVAIERAMGPAQVGPSEGRAAEPDLSRAMTFTPPAETKR